MMSTDASNRILISRVTISNLYNLLEQTEPGVNVITAKCCLRMVVELRKFKAAWS